MKALAFVGVLALVALAWTLVFALLEYAAGRDRTLAALEVVVIVMTSEFIWVSRMGGSER